MTFDFTKYMYEMKLRHVPLNCFDDEINGMDVISE
jgi:hypothetical protein